MKEDFILFIQVGFENKIQRCQTMVSKYLFCFLSVYVQPEVFISTAFCCYLSVIEPDSEFKSEVTSYIIRDLLQLQKCCN